MRGGSVELHGGLVHRQPSLQDGQAGLDEGGEALFLGFLGAEDGEEEVAVAFAGAAERVKDGRE